MPSAWITRLAAGQRPQVAVGLRELAVDGRLVPGRPRLGAALAAEDLVDVAARDERRARVPPALGQRGPVARAAREQRDRDVTLQPVLGVGERVDAPVLDRLQRRRVDVGAADEQLAAGLLLDPRERDDGLVA